MQPRIWSRLTWVVMTLMLPLAIPADLSVAPAITAVLNNSSNIPAGLPNSGIAPSTLFKILGTGLADSGDATIHSSEGTGLPTTLNNASVSVTVGTTTLHPALYYATPTQINAVLPAATPNGTATVTVIYNGTASNTFTIQVVSAAPGITTANGSAVAQHASPVSLITYTSSASPGETVILWGTGLGAVGNSDTTYDTSAHQTSVPYTVYIGDLPADIVYKGASVYPGVGVFGVTIPTNVPTGCYIPVVAVANGNMVSNIATLPIHAGGGVCSDPQLGYDGNQILTIIGRSTFNSGGVAVSQSTSPGVGVRSMAVATFVHQSAVYYAAGSAVSFGGCIVTLPPVFPPPDGGSVTTFLDAGTITVTGPGGTPQPLTSSTPGPYIADLPSIPSTGGAYVFSGSGGSQVGPFSATVSFPNPILSWTNPSAAATVTRSQGLSVTWTGGAPGTYVSIRGYSAGADIGPAYYCVAPVADAHFTVPPYILLSLPAGTGTTSVRNATIPSPLAATGIDGGGATGSVGFTANSTYN